MLAHVIVGAILSTTFITVEQVFVLPEASVTVHTMVFGPLLSTAPPSEELLLLSFETVIVPVQLSEYVGSNSVPLTVYVQIPALVHLDWFIAQLMVGASRSTIVIFVEHVAKFPEASVTVQRTVVVPLANTAPLNEVPLL